MQDTVKLKVDLDINTIQALAILGVPEMQEHIDNYNKEVHRWRNNIDRVAGFIEYVSDDYEFYPDGKDNVEDMTKFLEAVIADITPLLSDSQRKYIWDSLHVTHLENLMGISTRCQAIIEDTFDKTYYYEYIKFCKEKMDDILVTFNKVH